MSRLNEKMMVQDSNNGTLRIQYFMDNGVVIEADVVSIYKVDDIAESCKSPKRGMNLREARKILGE